MTRVTITYEGENITISSIDTVLNEEHYESYYDNSNPYDMCECLEDFIRLHIEIRD